MPDTYNKAIKSMVDVPYLGSMKYLDQQLRADRDGAAPALLVFEQRYIKLAREYGIPLFSTEVMRGEARQNELFAQGFSRAQYGSSAHNYGMAVDVVHSRRAWDLEPVEWEMLGQIGKEAARKANVKIAWLGDKKHGFYDPAHWQLEDWASLVPNDI